MTEGGERLWMSREFVWTIATVYVALSLVVVTVAYRMTETSRQIYEVALTLKEVSEAISANALQQAQTRLVVEEAERELSRLRAQVERLQVKP